MKCKRNLSQYIQEDYFLPDKVAKKDLRKLKETELDILREQSFHLCC